MYNTYIYTVTESKVIVRRTGAHKRHSETSRPDSQTAGQRTETHQKARLTIAELFEHGQHHARCSHTDGGTTSSGDAACLLAMLMTLLAVRLRLLFSIGLGLELEFGLGLWLTTVVTALATMAITTSRCRHSHRNRTRPPLRQQHDSFNAQRRQSSPTKLLRFSTFRSFPGQLNATESDSPNPSFQFGIPLRYRLVRGLSAAGQLFNNNCAIVLLLFSLLLLLFF